MPSERKRLWVALMRCSASLRLSIRSSRTVSSVGLSGMIFPFSAPLFHHIAPDKRVVIDERKMSLAVLKVAELRLSPYFSHPLFKRTLRLAYQPGLYYYRVCRRAHPSTGSC